MPQKFTPTTEVVTPSGSVAPSLVRTLVPVLVGAALTSLLDRFAIELDSTTAAAFVTAVLSWAYYVVVRFLEVYASPKWSYILGVGTSKQPVYPANDAPTNVLLRDEAGYIALFRGSGTTFGVALLLSGIIATYSAVAMR